MERQSNRSTIVEEKTRNAELEDYSHEHVLTAYVMNCYNGGGRKDLTNIHTF